MGSSSVTMCGFRFGFLPFNQVQINARLVSLLQLFVLPARTTRPEGSFSSRKIFFVRVRQSLSNPIRYLSLEGGGAHVAVPKATSPSPFGFSPSLWLLLRMEIVPWP